MAFDGNGNYIRIHNWTQDAANGLDINAGEMDAEDNSIQGAFNITVTRDGQGKMAADFLPSAGSTYNLGNGSLPWLNVTAKTGSIGPPGSLTTAWTVTGIANANAMIVASPNTAGQSFGLAITAGTNATDYAASIANAVGTNLFKVLGDGSIVLAAATGGGQGLGSINAVAYLLNNQPIYAGIPQNSQAGAYQLVLADANKHVYKPSGTATITVPANAAVAFPIGTAVTIVNDGSGACSIAITTDTMVLSPGGSTGTRTLGQFGSATLLKVTATRWFISGTGLS